MNTTKTPKLPLTIGVDAEGQEKVIDLANHIR